MYRIVDEGPPPTPEGSSPELRAFLSQCFEMDPTMRPSAEILFQHPWLISQLPEEHHQALRAQDSIPFLRRFSIDPAKTSVTSVFSAKSSPTKRSFSRSYSVPESVSAKPDQLSLQQPPLPSSTRDSLEVIPLAPVAPVDLAAAVAAAAAQKRRNQPRDHAFVKSTFSKGAQASLVC